MRLVDLQSFTPSASWRQRAAQATQQLNACNPAARVDFIRAHASIWRDLKGELIRHFGSRCWFTDAEEIVAQLDVEHFRPKAVALDEDGTEHEGYWWLAFELSNLRLAGQILNREHKRCFFPVRGGYRACGTDRNCPREEVVFLDPVKSTDVTLVAYDVDGRMRPSTAAEDADDIARVEITDRLFGLSTHQPLIEARQRVWRECLGKVSRIEGILVEERSYGKSEATRRLREEIMSDLATMARPHTPLSSVSRSCLEFSGKKWALALLRSVP